MCHHFLLINYDSSPLMGPCYLHLNWTDNEGGVTSPTYTEGGGKYCGYEQRPEDLVPGEGVRRAGHLWIFFEHLFMAIHNIHIHSYTVI